MTLSAEDVETAQRDDPLFVHGTQCLGVASRVLDLLGRSRGAVDVLFLQRPHEDEVIPNDKQVTLKEGDHLHSQPPADYGFQSAILTEAGLEPARATLNNQPDGWCFLVISEYELPPQFQPARVEILIKLPPGFSIEAGTYKEISG